MGRRRDVEHIRSPVKPVLPYNIDASLALSNKLRASLLELIEEEPLTIKSILRKLESGGVKPSVASVRRHLSVLMLAGLIGSQVVKGRRGGEKVYYARVKPVESDFWLLVDERVERLAYGMSDYMKRSVMKMDRGMLASILGDERFRGGEPRRYWESILVSVALVALGRLLVDDDVRRLYSILESRLRRG